MPASDWQKKGAAMEFREIIELAKKRNKHAVKAQKIYCIEAIQLNETLPGNRITYDGISDYNNAESATTTERVRGS